MSDRIPIIWVSNLKTNEEKEDFKNALKTSIVLKRFKEILEKRFEMLEVIETDYNSPSWAYLQAHANGRREELKVIANLLAFLD